MASVHVAEAGFGPVSALARVVRGRYGWTAAGPFRRHSRRCAGKRDAARIRARLTCRKTLRYNDPNNYLYPRDAWGDRVLLRLLPGPACADWDHGSVRGLEANHLDGRTAPAGRGALPAWLAAGLF